GPATSRRSPPAAHWGRRCCFWIGFFVVLGGPGRTSLALVVERAALHVVTEITLAKDALVVGVRIANPPTHHVIDLAAVKMLHGRRRCSCERQRQRKGVSHSYRIGCSFHGSLLPYPALLSRCGLMSFHASSNVSPIPMPSPGPPSLVRGARCNARLAPAR